MGAAASHIDGTGNQLVKAAKAGQVDLVTELLSAHPGLLKFHTLRNLTICHVAARANHVDVLEQLFSKAEEVEFLKRQHGGTQPDASIVWQLANTPTDRGVTPLMLAVERGCAENVKLLLSKGADPWAIDKLGGRTALHYAARRDSVELVQLLVDAAGETGDVKFPNRPGTKYVDVRTQSGLTAVHFAVHAVAQQTLAALLNCGAHMMLSSLFDSLDCINCTRGTTPLHLAARGGNVGLAQQLLKAYTDHWHQRRMPDPRLVMDAEDQLPCQVAARRHHAQLARMLLPSTPISTVVQDIEGVVLGPPSLANIVAAVLRDNLHNELVQVQQHLGLTLEGEQPQEQEPVIEQDAAEETIFDMELHSEHLQQPEQQQGVQHAVTLAEDATIGLDLERVELLKQLDAASVDASDCSSSANGPSLTCDLASNSSSSNGEAVCGVCFDEPAQVALAPCVHKLCVTCCKQLLDLDSKCVLVCPFCRGNVAHVGLVHV